MELAEFEFVIDLRKLGAHHDSSLHLSHSTEVNRTKILLVCFYFSSVPNAHALRADCCRHLATFDAECTPGISHNRTGVPGANAGGMPMHNESSFNCITVYQRWCTTDSVYSPRYGAATLTTKCLH